MYNFNENNLDNLQRCFKWHVNIYLTLEENKKIWI
jgi:hypothetical protein